ncbi:putative sporulation protein YtxC [Metabacillus endolithicus]|uniref:Sporulation protein YtxC n=1 Tax=Metabacillus endolithicus TaxID=1535204 RepID=A0ABW5BYG5_9BACI|nr:putative sporulation protein YtxC [Metabacillus endolithicus]UPG64773.1 putative sporulation protein YtxC [Metabacillus endolithicus]
MLEILFGSPKEARAIYSIFHSIHDKFHSELQLVNNQSIKLNPKSWDITVKQLVIPGLIQFIINHKEHLIMLKMIKENYYFSEEEEQQQIIHIAHSIMEGQREEIPRVQEISSREQMISDALEQFLRPDLYFSFSSFQKFRLHKYIDSLREYVEIAIEEYKMEQEYQSFVQSLRDYLAKKESKLSKLQIVFDQECLVYDQDKQLMTEHQLKKYIDKDFVYQHPMYIDKQLLAPLVSIAPDWLMLYTNNSFEGMVQTIQNIFEERVTIYPLENF